jgi:hypothetical protein
MQGEKEGCFYQLRFFFTGHKYDERKGILSADIPSMAAKTMLAAIQT